MGGLTCCLGVFDTICPYFAGKATGWIINTINAIIS